MKAAYGVQIKREKKGPREELTPVLVDEVRRSGESRSSGNDDEVVAAVRRR